MLMRKIFDRFRRVAKIEHTMEDEVLGTLTFNEEFHWWRGTMTLADGKISVLTIDGVKTDESISEEIRNMVKFLNANEPLIRKKIAVSMSELYNGQWGGGDTITPDEMAQKISLVNVSLYDEGGGELHYEADDDTFTDHTICTPFDENGEIGEPDLEG
ncbi:MAG TPA: DUF2262 domain-containing protein [Pyrinomonadaceae bacterium]|nr:DUF2262 domain-containing protein [Pyrinomonadaceae bacterium]